MSIESFRVTAEYPATSSALVLKGLATRIEITNSRRRSTLKIHWNPDFPQFFEPADNSNQKPFPLLSQTLQFYPRLLELSDFSNQFSFPLEVRKIAIPL